MINQESEAKDSGVVTAGRPMEIDLKNERMEISNEWFSPRKCVVEAEKFLLPTTRKQWKKFCSPKALDMNDLLSKMLLVLIFKALRDLSNGKTTEEVVNDVLSFIDMSQLGIVARSIKRFSPRGDAFWETLKRRV